MKRTLSAALLLLSISIGAQSYEDLQRPEKSGTPLELGMAGYAKVICSAVFVSGREVVEATHNSGYFLVPEEHRSAVDVAINWGDKQAVVISNSGIRKSATYHGDQGCIIDTKMGLHFEPVDVISALPPADEVPWPMGDEGALVQELDGKTYELLEKAFEIAFTPEALTAAMVVVHDGKILAERYDNGADIHMQLESWSMGKSLTATLVGRMIEMGYFTLDDRAPVTQWSNPDDPRSEITIRDLVQMSSGLHFTAHRDPEDEGNDEYLDHFYIYTGAIDAFDFSINRPLQFPVGTVGRYRNCDPMALGHIMRQKLGDKYWTFAQQELFDKIGIREQIMETDPYGNFLLSGYDYGTARNWARLGMLYLQDGMWEGERLLPEGWSAFVSSHAPAWTEPVYGGMFWLNGTGEFPLPLETYYMAGAGGQRTIIVPSMDLVIVRMGHFRGSGVGMQALADACQVIAAAVGSR